MYDVPSYVIALILALAMLASMWLGGAIGRRRHVTANGDSKSQANAVQGSLLGLLALLLGFTFSLSLGRYDERSAAVVLEANAIGTAWLRTDLIGDERREVARTLLREYGAIRLESATVAASDQEERARLLAEAEEVFGRLWRVAAAEAREMGNPVAMSFAASLNDMIDALATRDAAIDRHVPELVLILLFGTFILLGGVVGYSTWISNIRPGVPVYAMMILIVVLVFLIMDLDRPRRGLIAVDQSKLIATVAAMDLDR